VIYKYTAILSGNPDLKPEESTSYGLGVIYEFTENLDFSLDYYDYDIENVITKDTQHKFSNFGTDPNVVVRLPSDDPNDPGEVVLIYDRYENLGNVTTSGIDFNLNYRFATDMGEFGVDYKLNYVLDYEDFRPTAGVFATEGDFEQPEYRWTLAGTFNAENWNARAAVNYISSFEQDSAIREYEEGKFLPDIDAMTTVDLTVSYLGFESTSVTLGITNLFNEEPPFSYHDFMGYVTNVHSGVGREMYIQMKHSF
jgi:outer membrane receptor protein involved in Fe transport